MKYQAINLQGSNFTIIVLYIYITCLEEIRKTLQEKIKKAPYLLLHNTPIVINVANLSSYYKNWNNLYKIISESGLFVVGVCCCYDNKLKNAIIQSKLPILTIGHPVMHNTNLLHSYQEPSVNKKKSTIITAKLVNKPIRSGQKIYARNSDLIVIANVSSGAEIIADGNIHVYGIMRGRMLAGASGRKQSQIFCTYLFPELISIGGCYWLNDQIPKNFLGKAVRLSLKQDTLTIQYL